MYGVPKSVVSTELCAVRGGCLVWRCSLKHLFETSWGLHSRPEASLFCYCLTWAILRPTNRPQTAHTQTQPFFCVSWLYCLHITFIRTDQDDADSTCCCLGVIYDDDSMSQSDRFTRYRSAKSFIYNLRGLDRFAVLFVIVVNYRFLMTDLSLHFIWCCYFLLYLTLTKMNVREQCVHNNKL